MLSFITVIFTCQHCGIQRVRVPVLARKENQPITEWVEFAAQQCGNRHRVLAPHCTATKLDLAIPYDEKNPNARVGESIDKTIGELPDDFLKSRAAN